MMINLTLRLELEHVDLHLINIQKTTLYKVVLEKKVQLKFIPSVGQSIDGLLIKKLNYDTETDIWTAKNKTVVEKLKDYKHYAEMVKKRGFKIVSKEEY
jgi:hypothetical protein